jgi:hypothetical protein
MRLTQKQREIDKAHREEFERNRRIQISFTIPRHIVERLRKDNSNKSKLVTDFLIKHYKEVDKKEEKIRKLIQEDNKLEEENNSNYYTDPETGEEYYIDHEGKRHLLSF